LIALACGAFGCSSSSSPTQATTDSGTGTTTTAGDGGLSADAASLTMTDGGCPLGSGYPGDESCLAPPDPSVGFQLHYGPHAYASAADVAPFILQPGTETVDCYYEKTPNDTDRYVAGYQFYMRPGSHHLNMNINNQAEDAGFQMCQANDQSPGILGGSETPRVDELTDPAPENAGLAVKVPANSQAVINFHVINTTNEPILREAWLNYMYIDPSQVKGIRGNVFLVGGVGFQIQPGTHQTYQYSCTPERPTRVLDLAAHMHVHATRMSAWKVVNGNATKIYEAYDWSQPADFRFDSAHPNNPAPDPTTKTAGATSGQLTFNPGEYLQWECEVDNTSSDVLTFRNEVNTGEMCIMTGTMVPTDDPMNPYDFTCTLN
jgi:hypothetical protein